MKVKEESLKIMSECIKIKNLFSVKDTVKKNEKTSQIWDEIFATLMPDEGILSRIG